MNSTLLPGIKAGYNELSEAIGNLLYAVAADEKIQPLEVPILKRLVADHYLPDPDEGTIWISRRAHHILTVMDKLENGRTPGSSALKMFLNFYDRHLHEFTADVKSNLRETIEHIQRVFPGRSSDDTGSLLRLFPSGKAIDNNGQHATIPASEQNPKGK